MKISQKQANLLAKEILKQLKRENIGKVSELTIAKLKEFKEKRDVLVKAKNDAECALDKFDNSLKQIVGDNNQIRCYHAVNQMVEVLKRQNIPSLSEIEDKIILKGMFATDQDMDTFINGIIREFTRKHKNITQSN